MKRFLPLLLVSVFLCYSHLSLAQDNSNQSNSTTAFPVLFKADTLYVIKEKIGAFSPQRRAELVQQNLKQLSKLPLNAFDSLKVVDYVTGADIVYLEKVIASITTADAMAANTSVTSLAETHRNTIRDALIKDYNDNSLGRLSKDFGLFLLALIGFMAVFRIINTAFDYFRKNLKLLQRNVFFRDNKLVRFFTLITPETERSMLLFLLRMTRFTMLGIFLYLYMPFMFSQISYTRGFGERMMEYVLKPIRFLGDSFVSFLPNLVFIIIIIVAVRYLISGLQYFFRQVRTERFKINGFYPDWAFPTLNLLRVLIIIFTLVIIFPYLPGSSSNAFQGVSVFIGLLLSLGSAGAISNVISGIILTYMRPFKVGDRVKINDITGDILDKNLLVTRVKTLKNEEITIPNAILLSGGIINYSSLTGEHGLVIHTSITIGYDAPWKQVHKLLEDAAFRTTLIEKNPVPFVLQKSLDDWYVAYELNAYTKESHKVPSIYSELHAHIQDTFNEAGVEIMSSHYMALRDGNQAAVPGDYLAKEYKAPPFRVENNSPENS